MKITGWYETESGARLIEVKAPDNEIVDLMIDKYHDAIGAECELEDESGRDMSWIFDFWTNYRDMQRSRFNM